MRTLRLRPIIRAMLVAVGVTGAFVAVYGYVRVLPAGRTAYEHATALRELYGKLAAEQGALRVALTEAHDLIGRPDTAGLAALRRSLEGRDVLVSGLPLADAPPAIRAPLARALDEAARLSTVLAGIATGVELGRRDEARRMLDEADLVEVRLLGLVQEAQVGGLSGLVESQETTRRLLGEMLLVCLAWVIVSAGLAVLAGYLFERRLTRPLQALDAGMRRLEEGDLGVHVPVGHPDEMGEVTEHFNRMTEVLRDRATRQGQIAAAGELLAGAAHEVNNPLMAIAATAESRRGDRALSPEARGDFDGIAAEAHRAGQLLRAIVTFLRPGPHPTTVADPNELVRDTWGLLWPQLRADGVDGRLDLAPDLPPVRGERQKLQQMLVNLLSNARQAVMRDAGARNIVVRTACRDDGRTVAVEVEDSGAGVPGWAAGELFKPFFTTHKDGRVGLGLYTSRMIARAHGGDVAYEPRRGRTTFVITLPATERPAAPAAAPGIAAAAPAAAEPTLAGLTILLVDDEQAVRRPIARFLTRRGARVCEAGDGREALGIARENHVDLVITDLRMPGMDGIGMFRELTARAPALAPRVLFLSGDVAQLAELGGSDVPPELVVTKPIELAELEARILKLRRS